MKKGKKMEVIKNFKDKPQDNTIYVNPEKSFLKVGSKVYFGGKNNILYVEDGAEFHGCDLYFRGNNSVIYISKSRNPYFLYMEIFSDSVFFMGSDSYIKKPVSFIAGERKNIIFGNNCLISSGTAIRTADPHLIYDMETNRRINPGKSVYIGDHVWLGRNTLVFKGTKIGSGSVIGGGSVVPNKKIPSNVIAAGNPARVIKKGIFYSGECTDPWSEEMTEKYMVMDTDKYKFNLSEETIDIDILDQKLQKAKDSRERFNVILSDITANKNKNRFFIGFE